MKNVQIKCPLIADDQRVILSSYLPLVWIKQGSPAFKGKNHTIECHDLIFEHRAMEADCRITDLGNIKRRLYLSTVHKELSSTPLHAKIPLFMIKRKIWCNLCIDLAAFTSEVFKGAVFQSLDGIIVSANCRLRKIFTLKSKPQDTADKDDEPTDIIPRSCQLTTDVPHVTQLLNMTKLRQTEIKFGGHPLRSAESDQFINRGTGSVRNSKSQDVCHIAFGSKVLGPPPLSGKRNNLRLSTETLRSIGSKNSRSCQQPTVEKCVNSTEMSALLMSETEEQRDKENIHQVKQIVPVHGSSSGNNKNEDEATTVLTTVTQQVEETLKPSTAGHLPPDQAVLFRNGDDWSQSTESINLSCLADEWVFPAPDGALHSASGHPSPLLGDESCVSSPLWLDTSKDSAQDPWAEETQTSPKDVFTFSSRPRSAPHGKTQNMSPEGCPFILDLKEDSSMTRTDTHLEDDFYGGDSSEEEYNWRNYQPSGMSESELQMLASLRRQQKEELEDPGAPYGLSASQVDNCNVSISSSSDDTTTWNSCLPRPVNQGRHYQKEMNPPSPSNPRDWLNMLSPPIVPPSHQPLEKHLDSSGSLSAQGEEDLSVGEEEEVLTLLYDPCLNCYFDPQSGKYYELV
ncbi:hypothetical protein GW7_15338 [Heterocephalus glaber]|uniref:CFA20 domain-containing protein n=1 Tax=Heterocephalus glaber TaxID=10181 RepID=G5B0D1_HETGA|nr:hypothetical protein GW7_15338 [Heterocephalus glaber]